MTATLENIESYRTTAHAMLAHELVAMADKMSRGEIDPALAVPLMTQAAHHILRLEVAIACIREQIAVLDHKTREAKSQAQDAQPFTRPSSAPSR